MLKSFVTFYVPSTRDVGQPLAQDEHQVLITRVARQFIEYFGGYTETQGVGGWVSNNGELIEESVTLIKSYHGLDTSQALAIVLPLAQAIKSEYGQETIAIETESGIEFI